MALSRQSSKVGNWQALVACFLYFDTGFMVLILYGPIAPFIGRSIVMTAAEQGLLVSVPFLSAAILRVVFGNLYQAADGRLIALLGITLSALPSLIVPLVPGTPSYTLLLILGVFLGVGGASFAIALPMAGANFPPRMQGLVLGLAGAGNIGAVLDGFLLPGIAQAYGWQNAIFAAAPLLLIAAVVVTCWARDPVAKHDKPAPTVIRGAFAIAGLLALVNAVHACLPGTGRTTTVLLPALCALLALALASGSHQAVLKERDTWIVMLVYSITFGGYVGISSYAGTFLTSEYDISALDAGRWMAALACAGALLRSVGGLLADRIGGARVLTVIFVFIAGCDFAFWIASPNYHGALLLLTIMSGCFGLDNGATFQLVPHRWYGRTGIMAGVIATAGGVGGFYFPVVMGMVKDATGTYQPAFGILALITLVALTLICMLRRQWRSWDVPRSAHAEART
ncbi:MFS transporter [Burkholderia sp. ST111]|nr:MFS transporter [Burkholderia sp. ST111]